MKPEDSLELLRQAHREPIDEAHYAAVRARVLSDIAAQRGHPARRIWALLSAGVAVAALCVAFWPRPAVNSRPQIRAAAAHVKPGPPLVATRASQAPAEPRPQGTVTRRRPKHLATGVAGPKITQPLVVKMVTDDPNVVIYWITDGTGE